MCGRLAELVAHEDGNEGVAERVRGRRPHDPVLDLGALAAGWRVAPGFKRAEIGDATLVDEARHQRPHVRMQRPTAGDNDTDGDRAVTVQPLEVLEIPVEEGILVVPFDFQRDAPCALAGGELADVIDLMRLALVRNVIDPLLDPECGLAPASLVQGTSQPLCSLSFAAATSDDLGNRNPGLAKRHLQFPNCFGKIRSKDGPRV